MAPRRDTGGPVSTALPSQRSTFSRHAIPQVQSSRAGLEDIGAVFNSFFGQVNAALDNVNATIQLGEKQRIEQENKAEKVKAANDFYEGREADPSLSNDLDYMDTFRGLKANRMATDAARDFATWYQQDFLAAHPEGDLSAARDQWVRKNLGGLEDPEINAQVLSRFYQATETTLSQHTENRIRVSIENDLIQLETSLQDDVVAGDMTPERVSWYINAAKQIDPLNPNEAAPRVVAGLMASVRNNPQATQQVITTLTQPGTGINGRSFAESFPSAFADFQVGALQSYMQTNTLAEQDYFRALEEEIRGTGGAMSDEQIIDFTQRILTGRAVYGAGNQADALKDMLITQIQSQVETLEKVSLAGAMLDGTIPMDASHFRSNFDDLLKTTYGVGSIMELEPEQAASLITRMHGVVPENVKYHLTSALTNVSDPAGQERAIAILSGVKNAKGDDYLGAYLTNEGARYYEHISDHLNTNQPLSVVIATVNEARQNGRTPDNLDWVTVTGAKTQPEARKQVGEWVDSAVQTYFNRNGLLGMFKTDVTIPATLMSQIEDYALAVVAERGAENISPEDAVTEAVGRLLSNADVIGSPDHPVMSLGGQQVDATSGGASPRVRLGFNVMTSTGHSVNTVEIYRDELDSAFETMPWMFVDGAVDNVSLDTDTSYPGAFQLKDSAGVPIVFEPGETFEVNGETITFPDTEEGLMAAFGETLPTGFGFVRTEGLEGDGWKLMYRPHFGEYERYNIDVTDPEYLAQLAQEHHYNGIRTTEVMLGDLQSAMVAAQRREGLIPMSTGINGSLEQPKSAEDIINLLEGEMNRGIAQQGRRFVDRHRTQYDQTYRSRRSEFIVGSEAVRTHAYDDRTGGRVSNGGAIQGNVTVGIGFNMDRNGARETWDAVFGGTVNFDDVRSGKVAISRDQAQKLFDFDMRYFENVLMDAADGRSMPENEHLALLSITYNAPSRINDMRDAIANGDHSAIVNAMLYESFNPNHPQRLALASRRYREALHYAGSDPIKMAMLPSPEEYINHWR